jgi:hypothetical protein
VAKLVSQADRATIIACRGVIDFYYWKGMPVARAWPRKSTQPRTAGEIASSEEFTAAAKMTGALDAGYMKFWAPMAAGGHGVTWVDGFRAWARGKPWVT